MLRAISTEIKYRIQKNEVEAVRVRCCIGISMHFIYSHLKFNQVCQRKY